MYGPRQLNIQLELRLFIIKVAKLLATHRGRGSCYYQSCAAFIYLIRNERFCSDDINVEHFKITIDGGHHFLVLDRLINSAMIVVLELKISTAIKF